MKEDQILKIEYPQATQSNGKLESWMQELLQILNFNLKIIKFNLKLEK